MDTLLEIWEGLNLDRALKLLSFPTDSLFSTLLNIACASVI